MNGRCWLGIVLSLGIGMAIAVGPDAVEIASARGPTSSADETRSDQAHVMNLRHRAEHAMAELGRVAKANPSNADATRAPCVGSLRERGQAVMEVATDDLIVLADSHTDQAQRDLATAKVDAAATELERLVDGAKACTEDDEDKATETVFDERETVPIDDPTRATLGGPVPPSVHDDKPVSVASPAA